MPPFSLRRTSLTRLSAAARAVRKARCSVAHMSELEREIGRYLAELARRQASPHTLESYGGDLCQFLEYFTPPESEPPPLAQFGVHEIREWLADLYGRGHRGA